MAATALVAIALAVVTTSGSSTAATPALSPSATSVAVGSSLGITAPGCEERNQGDPSISNTQPEVVLITGTGPAARLAGVADQGGESRLTVTVPGWVDPALPAVLAGRCVRSTYDLDTGTRSTTVVFTYAEVAIDVTPGPANVRKPIFTLDRTKAAGGQVITVSASGCAPDSSVQAVLFNGGDLAPRAFPDVVFTDSIVGSRPPRGSSATIEFALNHLEPRVSQGVDSGDGDNGGGSLLTGGPVDPGDYGVLVVCSEPDGASVLAAPQRITVAGTNPSGAVDFRAARDDDDTYVASGEGCTGGRTVTVNLDTIAQNTDFFGERARQRTRALARGSLRAILRADGDEPGAPEPVRTTVTATPAADGSWSVAVAVPDVSFSAQATIDCGDPHADGFRYVAVSLFKDRTASVLLQRTSPTSSPVGGTVTVHAFGRCDDAVGAQFLDGTGTVLSSSTGTAVSVDEEGPGESADGPFQSFTTTVAAPDTPGQYFLAGTCGDERGPAEQYEVFAPATLAPVSPLPPESTTGYPSAGARETYHGRVGPITLPGAEGGRVDSQGAPTTTVVSGGSLPGSGPLGTTGVVGELPRPPGDLAITSVHVSLVDANGNPVGRDRAEIGYFVTGNLAKNNPACPNGTFGLPSQIVSANDSANTDLTFDDPYAMVVKGSDGFGGSYQLNGHTGERQDVYIAYDLDVRHDVDNVRPLTSYFGAATGCSSPTYSIDGSGRTDVQSTYIAIARDAVLVTAVGTVDVGGLYADLVDDRGRSLCRSDGMAPCRRLREQLYAGERLRFDAAYTNDRRRPSVRAVFEFFVWEGGGPAGPGPGPSNPGRPLAPEARPFPGLADYTG